MNLTNTEAPAFYVPAEPGIKQGLGFLMRKVLSSIRTQADTQLATYDLTYVQWVPLYVLMMGQCNTVAGLAREVEVDPSAMTRSLDRLEAKGLVRRERSTKDRRVVRLVLTNEGRRVASKVPPVLANVLNGHFRGFSEDERQQLQELLNRMLSNGEAMRQPVIP